MKIFNWVHRRFSTHKDGLGEAGRKSDYDYDDDKHENMNPFDGWKGGVLTIGTFGYDPLIKDIIQQQEDEEIEMVQKQQLEIEEEEVKPLMLAAYQHEGLMEIKMEANRVVDEFDTIDFEVEVEGIKERTTLAQLFSADHDSDSHNNKHHPININIITKGEEEIINNKSNHKNGFSFAKKLIADAPPRPIHKLHRLVRRMLKRKIHPDVGANKHINVNVAHDTMCETTSTTTTEPASLLSTQDGIVKLDG